MASTLMNSSKQIKKNMKMNAMCVNCVIDVIFNNYPAKSRGISPDT